MFHLVQPARPGGRMGDEGRPARLDEAGRRGAPGAGRRDAPHHAPQCGDGRAGRPDASRAFASGRHLLRSNPKSWASATNVGY